jgi:dTDP-4-dehydrorhamnose reductase
MIGILGASGYIGEAFVNELISQEISFREYNRERDNYCDIESLINIIHRDNISSLINCAGYTGKPNVDACEYNKDECYEANVNFPKNLSMACSLTNTVLIHVSSGCIYTGDKEGKGFTEEDAPNFHSGSEIKGSFYSATKALGESVVASTWGKSYIARLRIPFDSYGGPRNYLSKLQNYKKLLEATNSISHRGDFVKACIHLLKTKSPFGVYNIVNSDPISTSEVADMLKSEGLLESYELLNEEQFYKEVKPKAPRSNCVLDNQKLINTGFKIRSTKEALSTCIKEFKNGK